RRSHPERRREDRGAEQRHARGRGRFATTCPQCADTSAAGSAGGGWGLGTGGCPPTPSLLRAVSSPQRPAPSLPPGTPCASAVVESRSHRGRIGRGSLLDGRLRMRSRISLVVFLVASSVALLA